MLGFGLGLNKWRRVGGGFVGLLDLYPNAAAAYSLRKLRAAYTGSAVRVRKEVSSVSSETDIGFLADGTLDTVSLLAFASDADSGDVFVVTWYDQSLSNDATQGTGANQPKIVSGGSLVTENGKPAIKFDGVGDYLSNTFSSNIPQPTYWFVTHNFHAIPSAFDGVIGNLSTTPEHRLILNGSLIYTLQAGGSLNYNSYQTSQSLISYKIDASDERFYFNGSEETTSGGTGIGAQALGSIVIGTLNETSGHAPIQFQEIILYSSDQSANRTAIETNINTFYSIYP